ncbi:MAG: protease PrsW [Promethearchaeia archaeon]|nr:MAG: protease PrsW [Candidatus Lokiarchaeia archaeon]
MHYILLGFAPGLYWLWFFYRQDKLEPEPKKLVFIAYFLGILAAALVIFIHMPFKLDYFVGAVVSAPIFEELAKFLMVWAYLYRNQNFNEPMDGIVYAVAVALGFASIENGLYLFRINQQAQYLLSNTILIRALLSVPAHALFSGIWGYALGRYKFDKKKNRFIVVYGLLLAMLLHALFNFLCLIEIFSSFGLLILVAVMWGILDKKIAKAEINSPYAPRSFMGWKKKRKINKKK